MFISKIHKRLTQRMESRSPCRLLIYNRFYIINYEKKFLHFLAVSRVNQAILAWSYQQQPAESKMTNLILLDSLQRGISSYTVVGESSNFSKFSPIRSSVVKSLVLFEVQSFGVQSFEVGSFEVVLFEVQSFEVGSFEVLSYEVRSFEAQSFEVQSLNHQHHLH